MLDRAIVLEKSKNLARVHSLVCEDCPRCHFSCVIRGKSFWVLNKRNFPIEKNTIIRIGISPVKRAIHSLVSLVLPVVCAIFGYVLSPLIAKKIGFENTEIFKAVCLLFFLTASTGMVFAVSRSSIHFSKPEILQVLETN